MENLIVKIVQKQWQRGAVGITANSAEEAERRLQERRLRRDYLVAGEG